MIKGTIGSLLADQSIRMGKRVSTIQMNVETNMDIKDIQDLVESAGPIYITKQHETIKPWHYIQDIYVNEEKKTVVVKFKDGKVIKKTACEGDTFDTYAGVALCLISYLCGSTKDFHSCVDRRIKKSGK